MSPVGWAQEDALGFIWRASRPRDRNADWQSDVSPIVNRHSVGETMRPGLFQGQRVANPRHSRLPVGATTVVALFPCAPLFGYLLTRLARGRCYSAFWIS